MTNKNLYQNIAARTGGDIYLGVVGPVRTGKSTFIKRFMDLMVLPRMEESAGKQRTIDELPQSAQGKTIMTTEPKFIPREAATIQLDEDVSANVKLIDCVGYLIDGVSGHMEDGAERMVKTPWYSYEIPFAKAAQIGTEKGYPGACNNRYCGDNGWQFHRYSTGKLCPCRRKNCRRIMEDRQAVCHIVEYAAAA